MVIKRYFFKTLIYSLLVCSSVYALNGLLYEHNMTESQIIEELGSLYTDDIDDLCTLVSDNVSQQCSLIRIRQSMKSILL